MADQKIFVGSGKEWGQYGNVGISICMEQIQPYVYEYNGKHYVKLNVSKKQSPDQYGKTHSVSVDTWKPDGERAPLEKPEFIKEQEKVEEIEYPEEEIDPNDIPFD
jgi:hypothetical protein